MRRVLWGAMAFVSLLLVACGPPSQARAVRPAVPKSSRIEPSRRYFTSPVYYEGRVVVLMFHAFLPGMKGDYQSPALFQAELEALLKAHMNVVSLQDALAFVSGKGTLAPNAVLITIDDGDQSVFTGAYPALKALGLPFTCFIIAGGVGEKGRMDWQELQTMEASGLVSYGSHTYASHGSVPISPSTTSAALVGHEWAHGRPESEAAYQTRVLTDLTKAKTTLEAAFGRPVTAFAYPFGAYDPQVIDLLREVGYSYAFTTVGGAAAAGSDPYRLPRINVGQSWQTPKSVVSTIISVGKASLKKPFVPPTEIVPIWR